MKKICFVLFCLCGRLISADAQLSVYSSGRVGMANLSEFPYSSLSIRKGNDTAYSQYDFNLYARNMVDTSKSFYIGLNGETYPTTPISSSRAIGVRGIAGGTTNGYNYGVLGSVLPDRNGAGVLGVVNNVLGVYVPGLYAGYFSGEVKVAGTLTATSIVTPSDIRLKENVTELGNTESGNTLSRLKNLNVISYTYKELHEENVNTDSTASVTSQDVNAEAKKNRHIGLIAQELKDVYPELVVEGQDGYLGVNYVELVPVLLQSIKELNEKIESLENGERKLSRSTSEPIPTNASLNYLGEDANGSLLSQNTPNPFSERTTIRFSLPDDATSAYIYIFDMTGKMQRQIPIDASMDSVTINGYELSPGMYIYSLVIGGKEIDTKRMILSK